MPTRPRVDAEEATSALSLWKVTNEGFALLATLGLLTGLLYLFGRSYGSALLTVLKLPQTLLPISLTQYYEWGAVPLMGFAVLLVVAGMYLVCARFLLSNPIFLILTLIIDGVVTLLTWPLRAILRRLPKLRRPQWLPSVSWRDAPVLRQWFDSRLARYTRWFPVGEREARRMQWVSDTLTRMAVLVILLATAIGLLSLVLTQSETLGRTMATRVMVQPVRVFTTQVISVRPLPATTLADGTTGYAYRTLFFLARGEQSYFVFDALVPATCAPREVIQLPTTHIHDAEYGTPQTLEELCQAIFPPPAPTPTPQPIPSVAPAP